MSTETILTKINFGAGETKLEGFINIDCEERTKPDLIHDIKKSGFPFGDNIASEFYCIHNIEHIEYPYWPFLFSEIHRILVPDGKLVLAYPEFDICAKYFKENKSGARDFWRNCLYGRQLYPGDYHVTPVITSHLIQCLQGWGFKNFKHGPESQGQEWATILTCEKGLLISRQSAMRKLMTGHYEAGQIF